ncbi:MAG: cysteine desulfurase [Bacteroides sp.]|nr:cysteine desulfurase [Bacteroidales bacterium]MBD5305776.1 cysteine desulfurase [Bacteroides sp.]MBD5348834.1 cysteine desulfurase [Bacteroides sp.]
MDIKAIREKFPILGREVNGRPLIYLDNTATSETPSEVVKEISWLYENTKANVHRGVHRLSQEATDLQEQTRRRVQKYINARSFDEIIFTRGTTEAINLVASSYGQRFKDGDEIILTVMEHHANIVPWQLLRSRADIKIRVVDINERGELDLEQYRSLFNERTVFASFCHVSNVLGTVNPVKEMVEIAHSHNVPCLVDGAQASPHLPIDVAKIGCDFYAFSSHKMYGPTGLGILYGRKELLEDMPPYQGGGEMISHVTFEHTTFADLPFKFEAGTPDFIGIAAFSKALDFIESTGLENIGMHEHELLKYTTERLNQIEGLKIYGTAPDKSAVISFNVGNIHNYDIGLLLDHLGVAVRTGHHCAQPLMERLGVPGTVRASFAVYNTIEEADKFIEALQRVIPMLG